ncbi:hypothetical protein F511_33674 [Dorcoceras hygrometricum]|uniref:Uncharacterized protein n=1 Tax=Dorcoceras hygrometricum TaxID=472368 RepID=A0A2Z7AD73_9LAMI|nr:hypothetical protein F511_33674 [Dorcoceras hygrometricum]
MHVLCIRQHDAKATGYKHIRKPKELKDQLSSCQSDRTKDSGHEVCESVVPIHSSQHTVPEHNQITQPDVAKLMKVCTLVHTGWHNNKRLTDMSSTGKMRVCNYNDVQQPAQNRTVIRKDSADGIRVEFYRVLLRSVNDSVLISWYDVVEVHSIVSADEDISRYFLRRVQQLLSLFVEDCDTTSFDLVGTTAFGSIQQKRSLETSADVLYQQTATVSSISRCTS